MLRPEEIAQEIVIAKLKHGGKFPIEPLRALGLLAEEFGEAAKEAVEATRHPRYDLHRVLHLSLLRKELIQVVAVCNMWIENLDLERVRDDREQANFNRTGRAVGE